METNGAGSYDTCRKDEVLDESISGNEVFMEDGEVNDTDDNKVTIIMVHNNEPPRNPFHVQTPQNQPQSQQHKNNTQQFNTNLLATVTENDSVKKQFNQSSMKNVSYKNKTVMSGLYPAESRDSLICNNNNNEGKKIVSIENCTDLVVEAKISGYVDEMLSDSGTEISLLDEQLLKRYKNHFLQTPVLPVSHTRIKSATYESQIIEKQALKTEYVQDTRIDATVLGVRKLGHNIILEVDELNKLPVGFPNNILRGKVDSVEHLIRLGRSKDKITNNSLTRKFQFRGCEIKQIRRILNKCKSTFPSKRVRLKTEIFYKKKTQK